MAKLKRPFDPITAEYVERELQKLQAEQEMLRASKGMGGPTDKMPTTGGSGQFGPAEFKYGGKKKYSGGSFLEKPKNYSTQEDKPAYWDLGYSNDADIMDKMNKIHTSMDTREADMNKVYAANNKAVMDKMLAGPQTQKKKFDWAALGTNVAQLAPGISETLMGLVNKDDRYTKFPNAPTNLVNYNQAATDITNQSGLMQQAAKQAWRNQGQSSGAYLAGLSNLSARFGQQTGAQLAELRMNEANTNAQIKNQVGQYNAGVGMARENAKAQNRAARESAITAGLAKIGQTTGGIGQDKNKAAADKKQLEYILANWDTLFPAANKPKLG